MQSQTELTTMERQYDTQYKAGTSPPHQLHEQKTRTARMQVKTPSGLLAFCYLDTHSMTMRYQTPCETVVDGNLSLNWIISPADKRTGIYISNAVTAGANTPSQFQDRLQTYLNYNYCTQQPELFVLGEQKTIFFTEWTGRGENECYIYTDVADRDGFLKYYLTPTDDGRIIIECGEPKYHFMLEVPASSCRQFH